jgi:hypothetical protein
VLFHEQLHGRSLWPGKSSAEGVNGELTSGPLQSHACVTRMRLETKFLRLKTPVTLGSRFGDWRVCWLGGWTRHRLSYLVMVVRTTGAAE